MQNILNLKNIEEDFLEVQKNYDEINSKLEIQREDFSDAIIQNLLCTYEYVNYLLGKDINLFDGNNNYLILEINNRVLLGDDLDIRKEYVKFISTSMIRFKLQIDVIVKHARKIDKKGDYNVCAGMFAKGVSQPQLFFEGNHRSHGAMINYLLLKDKKSPFILNVENAVAFFNPSQDIKQSFKKYVNGKIKLNGHKEKIRKILKEYSSDRYVTKKKN